MSEQQTLLRRAAIDLLTRREHSRKELYTKLLGRTEFPEELELVLDRLEEDRLLSDDRFVECFIRARVGRGYGPVRIRQELQQKGVNGDVVREALNAVEADWCALARESRQRKFGGGDPVDNRDRAKQMRYLQYRGFDMDAIQAVMRGDEE